MGHNTDTGSNNTTASWNIIQTQVAIQQQFCLKERLSIVHARKWESMCTLKNFILMPDTQEAKCFEFTVKILPPPPVLSNDSSWKYKRCTPPGCKDIGIRKIQSVAKTQFR